MLMSLYTDRTVHIRMFVELVEVKTGSVVHAGFLDATTEDEILRRHAAAYAKVHPESFDFSRPNADSKDSGIEEKGFFKRLFSRD